MSKAPTLLDEAGEASVATAIMMSHHGFRRDLARFAAALAGVAGGKPQPIEPLSEEWRSFRNTLHGHHHAEDTGLFPSLGGQHPSLGPTLARLTTDHRHIDPLLDRGDGSFADLPRAVQPATAVIDELRALLDPHLATEEADVIPHLRQLKTFPPPSSPQEAEMLTQGFAWACHGVAPEVLEKMFAMLPAVVVSRLPAARTAFEQRWVKVWGPVAVGASVTPIPDR
jgi:hypothetical protein